MTQLSWANGEHTRTVSLDPIQNVPIIWSSTQLPTVLSSFQNVVVSDDEDDASADSWTMVSEGATEADEWEELPRTSAPRPVTFHPAVAPNIVPDDSMMEDGERSSTQQLLLWQCALYSHMSIYFIACMFIFYYTIRITFSKITFYIS